MGQSNQLCRDCIFHRHKTQSLRQQSGKEETDNQQEHDREDNKADRGRETQKTEVPVCGLHKWFVGIRQSGNLRPLKKHAIIF